MALPPIEQRPGMGPPMPLAKDLGIVPFRMLPLAPGDPRHRAGAKLSVFIPDPSELPNIFRTVSEQTPGSVGAIHAQLNRDSGGFLAHITKAYDTALAGYWYELPKAQEHDTTAKRSTVMRLMNWFAPEKDMQALVHVRTLVNQVTVEGPMIAVLGGESTAKTRKIIQWLCFRQAIHKRLLGDLMSRVYRNVGELSDREKSIVNTSPLEWLNSRPSLVQEITVSKMLALRLKPDYFAVQ